MKLRELKERIDKAKESDLDNDVVFECGHDQHRVKFAKNINYNKRDQRFTPRIFLVGLEYGTPRYKI